MYAIDVWAVRKGSKGLKDLELWKCGPERFKGFKRSRAMGGPERLKDLEFWEVWKVQKVRDVWMVQKVQEF